MKREENSIGQTESQRRKLYQTVDRIMLIGALGLFIFFIIHEIYISFEEVNPSYLYEKTFVPQHRGGSKIKYVEVFDTRETYEVVSGKLQEKKYIKGEDVNRELRFWKNISYGFLFLFIITILIEIITKSSNKKYWIVLFACGIGFSGLLASYLLRPTFFRLGLYQWVKFSIKGLAMGYINVAIISAIIGGCIGIVIGMIFKKLVSQE